MQRKLTEYQPDPNNANLGTERGRYALEKSLEKFGAGRSILTDKNGVIIAGNKTLETAVEAGFEHAIEVETDGTTLVVVKRTDLDLAKDSRAKELAIADNRVAELDLAWSSDAIAQMMDEEVDLSDFFREDELQSLLDGLKDEPEPEITPEQDEENTADLIDKAEQGKIEPRFKLGEIWQLGRHKIACCDSTDEDNVRSLLGDRFDEVGMVWSDAPYGMRLDADFSGAKSRLDFAQDKKAFGGNKYENVIGDHEDFDPRPILELFPKAEQFWWGADYYAERITGKNAGSWFVWDKRVEESMDAVYGSGFELCWSIKKHKRQLVRVKWAGIFGMEKEDTRSRVHPTQKPNDLCVWFFERYSKPSDLIFDPFLGSAPSIIAAQKMEGDRTVYGCELSPEYCEIIARRFESFTGVNAKLVGHL